MVSFIKQYWDIIGGILISLSVSVAANFELRIIQLCYSMVILMIVCIGILRVFKQEMDKRYHNERKPNVVDTIIDTQKPVKALSIAQVPTQEGEILGRKIIKLWEVMTPIMEKLKAFFSKFKGYMLTATLAILTILEMCGGFINDIFGGTLVINGVEILPIVTLVCTAVVGILSNGYSKEQMDKIKSAIKAPNTNEYVKNEIKKAIKEKSAELSQYTKTLEVYRRELADLEFKLENALNTVQAKREMFNMVPQLATDADVQNAEHEVNACRVEIANKSTEIRRVEDHIKTTTTTLNALKTHN